MSTSTDLQDITERIEKLLQDIRSIEGSPSSSRRKLRGSPSYRGTEGSVSPIRRRTEGSTSPIRRETERSLSPSRRGTEGSVSPIRRETERSLSPSRRGTEGSISPIRQRTEASRSPIRQGTERSLSPRRQGTERSPSPSGRGTEGLPSAIRPVQTRLLFEGSPGRQSPGSGVTFTPARSSPYHAACAVPAGNVDDITARMRQELQMENEKRRKLEQSLSHVQEELNKTKAMADDINQSKRLALAMLKQLHNEYTKLQRRYQHSIRESQDNASLQRSLDLSLTTQQEKKLSSLSKQLQSEVSKRRELENRLNKERSVRTSLEEKLSQTVRRRLTFEDETKHKQMEERAASSDDTYQDCHEDLQPETPKQDFNHFKKSINRNEMLHKIASDKGVNAAEPDINADELNILRNRCAELENQLKQTSTVSQELSTAQKRCNELETQLKEYTDVSTELNDYRERLQKNVQQLHDLQSAFTQLQEAFRSAQTESNNRLEEKEKLIATLKENESLMNTENETLREIVKDLNALAQSYLERIQELWNKKVEQEAALEQKLKELKEKEKSVSESGNELKAMCKKCTEQEKQINDLQKTVNSLEDKYGHLTVESATYACENVVRRELLEDDIEKKREVLKDIENQLETKNKALDKQAYTIVQLRCRIKKQDREIESLQAELDRLYADSVRNEEVSPSCSCANHYHI